MQGKRILVVGYGKLGSRVAEALSTQHEVTAIKRSPIEHSSLVNMCFADITNKQALSDTLNERLNKGVNYLIYCLSPHERSEQGYRDAYLIGLQNIMSCLPKFDTLEQVFFVSSTSVYHQENGEPVDEKSPCMPTSFSGKVLLEAESYLANLAVNSTVIRFSGIYGGSRSRLIDQVKRAIESGDVLYATPSYTNRIHEDDCMGFICHLIDLLDKGQEVKTCYLATDSCPVKQAEVYRLIASQLEPVSSSKQTSTFRIEENAAKSTRRAGSKRCQNTCMKQSAYQLKYKSYKEGYLLS